MFKYAAIIIFFVSLIINSGYVFAQTGLEYPDAGGNSRTQQPVALQDPLNNQYTADGGINKLIGTVISAVLGIVGSLALAMFIYGGFVWMTAAGNKTNVEKGKDIITWAALGLVVIFSAYALVNFILTRVIGGA